jgi:hypothetical protein
MFRQLLFAVGVVEAVFPRRVVDAVTRLGYEHPEEFEPKPWVVTAARVEGLLLVALVLRSLLVEKLGRLRSRGDEN